jgi:hypothetical protein
LSNHSFTSHSTPTKNLLREVYIMYFLLTFLPYLFTYCSARAIKELPTHTPNTLTLKTMPVMFAETVENLRDFMWHISERFFSSSCNPDQLWGPPSLLSNA